MSTKSIGRHSPSKSMAFDAIQQAKAKPDYQMTGGPLDKHLARWNKNKQQMLEILESTLSDDRINDHVDAFLERVEQIERHSSDYSLLELGEFQGRLLKRDVRNAYRRKARKLHPDHGGDAEAFTSLYDAYRRILSSVPEK